MVESISILSPIYVSLFWVFVFVFSFSLKNQSKIVLALFMFSSFILFVGHGFFFLGTYLQYFNYEPIYVSADLLVYPLFYIYIRLLTVDRCLTLRHLYHFIPALLIGVAMYYSGSLLNNEEKINYVQYFLRDREINSFEMFSASWFRMVLFLLGRVIFIIQVFYALLNGIILIKQHEEGILNIYSNRNGKSLFYLKVTTLAFLFTACMSIVFAIIGRNHFAVNSQLLIIPSAIFSGMIFLIGFQGFHTKYIPVSFETLHHFVDETVSNIELKERLLNLFEHEQVFKNPELELKDVSNSIKLDNSKVANLINDEFKVNFRDFVNQYRISVAKKLIIDGAEKNLTIDKIAEEAGFSDSKSFARVFKEYEGMNPIKFKEVMDGMKD